MYLEGLTSAGEVEAAFDPLLFLLSTGYGEGAGA